MTGHSDILPPRRGKKGNLKKKKKSIKTKEECSTGFHCLLLASGPMFSRAHGARVLAIILLRLPPRWIPPIKPREKGSQWVSSSQAQHWAVSTKVQSSWSHLPSTWLADQTGLWSGCFWHVKAESRIKAEELLPRLKTHYLVGFQKSCFALMQPRSLTPLGSHGPCLITGLGVPPGHWHSADVTRSLLWAAPVSPSTAWHWCLQSTNCLCWI